MHERSGDVSPRGIRLLFYDTLKSITNIERRYSWISPRSVILRESFWPKSDPFHVTRPYIIPVIESQERAQDFNGFSITAVPVPEHTANLMRSGMNKHVRCFMMYKPLLFNSWGKAEAYREEYITPCQCALKLTGCIFAVVFIGLHDAYISDSWHKNHLKPNQ